VSNSILNRWQKTATNRWQKTAANPSHMLLYGGTVRVLAMESQCKVTNTPSLSTPMVDEETLRPLVGSQVL